MSDNILRNLNKMVTRVINVEKNGVKVAIKQQYDKEINDINIDFTEHDKVFEDKIAELKKDYNTASQLLGKYQQENEGLKQHIAELEQSRSEWADKAVEWQQKCEKLESKETETCEKEPIFDDCIPSMEWYDNRHQSDCIEINRLNTTIDVLIHKVEYLRQFTGLE